MTNARSESLADARIVRGMKSPSPLIEEGGSDEALREELIGVANSTKELAPNRV